MTKPSLNIDALAEELGAVALFARQPKVSAASPTPPESHPVEPLEGPKTAGERLPDQDVIQPIGALDRPLDGSNLADGSLGRAQGLPDLPDELPEAAGQLAAPRESVPSPARPSDGRTSRRNTTRYAFEFYQDQVERLRGLSLEDRLRGQKGSMSEMVREALDEYLAGKGERE